MIEIQVDSQRIERELKHLATFSDAPAPAVTRILFTETELAARNYIRSLLRDAGLAIREDAVGNIFGRWQGTDAGAPAIATGSHIDAIPYSGMYDGTVGVIGAIEAVRALKQANYQPQKTIEIIMFTAEEPTRFGLGCLGSRAMAGELSADDLRQLKDEDGRSFDAVRQEAGYTTASLDTVKCAATDYGAFIELHIEQGTRLEQSGNKIGIVTAIAAPATLRAIIHGDGGHAGAVLMPQRRDALPAAAEIVLAVENAAQSSPSSDAVATVGLLEVHPNAVNSIPNRVLMEIDIRDIDLTSRDSMVTAIQTAIKDICAGRGLTADVTVLNANKPSQSGDGIVTALDAVCQQLDYSSQKLVSRAYHDALFMAELCPTSMIFIPSEHGYSHRPEEFSSLEDITIGVTVLAETLARLSA